jgi:hypothetical protein
MGAKSCEVLFSECGFWAYLGGFAHSDDPFVRTYPRKINLINYEGPRVYKCTYLGGQKRIFRHRIKYVQLDDSNRNETHHT